MRMKRNNTSYTMDKQKQPACSTAIKKPEAVVHAEGIRIHELFVQTMKDKERKT